MGIKILLTGKTDKTFVKEGVELYAGRISKYIPFQVKTLPGIKKTGKMPVESVKEKEGNTALREICENDFVILLDEKGKQLSSVQFSEFLNKKMNESVKNLVFIIGGAYGFHNKLRQRAQLKLSLSKMTFSHQIVRIIFLEQLYRAFTIIRGEPYHNE